MILAVEWYHNVLAFIFAVIACLLMLVVLLQRGRGTGLSGAFGGTGGHTAFGAKTGDFLTWITIALAGLFLICSVVLNYVFQTPDVTTAPRVAPTPGAPATPESPTGRAPLPAGMLGEPFTRLVPFGCDSQS